MQFVYAAIRCVRSLVHRYRRPPDRALMADTINLFMWGYQAHFRLSVRSTVEAALEELGCPTEADVFLIGFLQESRTGHPLCIEPEHGPLAPADLEHIPTRADQLLNEDPERNVIHSHPIAAERHERVIRNSAWRRAIKEALDTKLDKWFVVAAPTRVAGYDVFTAIGLASRLLGEVPTLHARKVSDDDPIVLTTSLLDGALNKLQAEASRALYGPDPGSGFGYLVEPGRVLTHAGESLAMDAAYRADSSEPAHGLFDTLNQLATTRYETRAGVGRLVVANPASLHIEQSLLLDTVVPLRETRTLRKLLETSRREGDALLTNGAVAYGLGDIRSSYDPALESVFEVVVSGPGSWDLRHAGTQLMTVTYGAPRLPAQRLSRAEFEDTAKRLFAKSGGCDPGRLWELALACADAEHGTMLVVSADARGEASRLGGQALVVKQAELDGDLMRQVTRIDGAVLVEPDGSLVAIGVILDGLATTGGDRARGARYNSAMRYLASARHATMIVLVSEDGMLDLMPRLRPRMKRAHLSALLDDLRTATAVEPVDAERFHRALNRVKSVAFYLSSEQCDQVNELVRDHWDRLRAEGATIWIEERPLAPHPLMSDEYLADA